MKNKHTIVCIIGTRPEAIKMAPVIRALRATSWAHCVVVATGQHRSLLDQMLQRLGIAVDHDLNLMQDGQRPSALLARMLPALESVLLSETPATVLAQGDTTTVFGAAIAAFHCNIPFGHVEAGLRTHNLAHPFPEEGYRQMVSRIARWHFAPTQTAADDLLAERVPPDLIHITGNTCIDTLLQTVAELEPPNPHDEQLILLTVHRRENFGTRIQSVFQAIKNIVAQLPYIKVIYPVHPNPNVHDLAHTMLSDHPQIQLCEPLDYFEFVDLMRRSALIITDSGGVQEEAPALGKPVLILRETTERPEAVEAGVARLVGTETPAIVSNVIELLENEQLYQKMSRKIYPYGDGHASSRIADIIYRDISRETRPTHNTQTKND
jgi:UDP-N-acetylglucosamine 2-epimerase (non-hydrolysing)